MKLLIVMEARVSLEWECCRGPDFRVSLNIEVQVVGDGQVRESQSLSSQVVKQYTSKNRKTHETLDSRKGDDRELEPFSHIIMLCRIKELLVLVKVKELN